MLPSEQIEGDFGEQVSMLDVGSDAEAKAQKLIRMIYLNNEAPTEDDSLPKMMEPQRAEIDFYQNQRLTAKTAFILASVALKHDLLGQWSASLSSSFNRYFSKYTEKLGNPYYRQLATLASKRISLMALEAYERKDFEKVIQIYGSHKDAPVDVINFDGVRWNIADSYEKASRYEEAIRHYEKYTSNNPTPELGFLAYYRVASLSDRLLRLGNLNGFSKQRKKAMGKTRKISDAQAWKAWNSLATKEQQKFLVDNGPRILDDLRDGKRLKSPALILFDAHRRKSELAVGQQANNINRDLYKPEVLLDLAETFSGVGMLKEKKEVILMIEKVDPSAFQGAEELLQRWQGVLTDLAEDLRQRNKFSDAARIFKRVADAIPNLNNRAEYLYKSGLLYFRSGQRDNAIQALTQASEDGNNIYYSNLAKKRLSQIN